MQSAEANLLFALDALLQEGSVTGAARRMNVSAPAMSHTLARLRHVLRDPLFVRAGNRLVPTPRAVEMRDRVGRAAGEISALLRPAEPLDLSTLERTFVIRASDAVIVTVGRALEGIVRREAPRVALRFVASPEGVEVDLDVGVQHGRGPDTRVQRLYQDELVPVVRRGHPLVGRKVSLSALDHVVVVTKPVPTPPRASRIVPSYLAAISLVQESNAYTLVPARFAAAIRDVERLSVGGPARTITIAQAWSLRLDRDAAHTWLRGCVRRAAKAS